MEPPVVLFDGVCNLCTRSVQFILKRDPKGIFRFASLQSDAARKLLAAAAVPPDRLDTMYLVEEGRVVARSTALLRIARRLSGGWPLWYACILIPPFLRDAVYNLIARNRYRWFGRRDSCMVPTPDLRDRFL